MHSDEPAALPRVAGAPRLIEWTGERCVPWAPDVQVVYEHFHRYLWAAPLIAGRRVLDLASGEGFGAALLAQGAAAVVGTDIDERSVEHSRLNYDASNLTFAVADARDLAAFDDDSFGAVVAFEMIEHVQEQDRVLQEIQRVLEPDGLLIISTPDRDAYEEASGENPFHLRELSRSEFAHLLESRFTHVGIWGQRTITGSALSALNALPADAPAFPSVFVERADDAWRVAPGISPLYVVAVASNADLPPVPTDSTLGDCGLELVRVVQHEAKLAADAAHALRQQIASLEARAAHDAHVQRQQIAGLEARAAHNAHTISTLDTALNAAQRRYLRIEGSVTWQLFQRLRRLVFGALGGERSRGVGALQSMLRFLGRQLPPSGSTRRVETSAVVSRPPGTGPISLPEPERPDVSIVIPIHAHADLTRAALESIRDHTETSVYEVLLVDDAADPATKALLEKVRGARLIVNETNIGYLHSVQRGAAAARGRWLVLCNNDIEVQPGWLAALLDCGESRPDIGIVAPKFMYPDGALAEAGAIVWRDGTGANYGRGDDPTACHYEYRREIDYGSAAALLVKADFWREVGGFDERFLPMYYEDTDLCFEARERGLRVMFEPGARVIHVEGATAGLDIDTGHKRHQEENRPKFTDKWHERLEREHLPNDSRNLWVAANRRRDPHVLVVDHRIPTWDRDSGSLRMRGMIEALRELDCHVVFVADNMMPLQPYTRELQRVGVEVLYGVDVESALAKIGSSLSLVILSRPDTARRWLERVREHAPTALVVYDTVDLHWLREARQTSSVPADANGAVVLSPKAAAMRELELALIRVTDATLVVTENERAQVQADVPGTEVHVLPNVNRLRTHVPGVDGRAGVLFVGGFEHPPNVDGARALVEDVMPLVWCELPETRVTIVGPDPPPMIWALQSSQVEVTGWVRDLDPVVDSARVLVAPLWYGAGLKGKVTQALADGLPVVTTPIGAEGLDAVDGEQVMIGETTRGLADRVIAVLLDGALWQRLSRSGQELAAARCAPAVMLAALTELVRHPGVAERPAQSVSLQAR